MQQVARETWVAFERRLERAGVPAPQRPDYHKWTRFYLDFCHKYSHPPRSATSLVNGSDNRLARSEEKKRRPAVWSDFVRPLAASFPGNFSPRACEKPNRLPGRNRR